MVLAVDWVEGAGSQGALIWIQVFETCLKDVEKIQYFWERFDYYKAKKQESYDVCIYDWDHCF